MTPAAYPSQVAGAGTPGYGVRGSCGGPGPVEGLPGPAYTRSLAEIELEARFRGLLAEIDYLRAYDRLSAAEAVRRRRDARVLFIAALQDLRAWEVASGC